MEYLKNNTSYFKLNCELEFLGHTKFSENHYVIKDFLLQNNNISIDKLMDSGHLDTIEYISKDIFVNYYENSVEYKDHQVSNNNFKLKFYFTDNIDIERLNKLRIILDNNIKNNNPEISFLIIILNNNENKAKDDKFISFISTPIKESLESLLSIITSKVKIFIELVSQIESINTKNSFYYVQSRKLLFYMNLQNLTQIKKILLSLETSKDQELIIFFKEMSIYLKIYQDLLINNFIVDKLFINNEITSLFDMVINYFKKQKQSFNSSI